MIIDDDKPTHLIERAAARLRQSAELAPAADPPPVAVLERASPQPVAARPAPARDSRRPALIDMPTLAKGGLIDGGPRGARILEELSIAQNNLLRYSFGENGAAAARSEHLVMITSALSGEGKSFVALNLAAAVARQAERRVLLIDADAKPNSLGHLFGLSGTAGLLDLATGEHALADLAIPTARANLEFLPLGGSGEALSRARMASLVSEIGRQDRGRLILLDTAPCLSSSDAHTLAPVVGQTVFVIAAGLTQQGEIESALELVQTCPVVSLLLNKVKSGNGLALGTYGYHSAPHA